MNMEINPSEYKILIVDDVMSMNKMLILKTVTSRVVRCQQMSIETYTG